MATATATWTAPPSGGSAITGYVLQRRAYANNLPGAWETLATLPGTALSYADTTVTLGTRYGYRLAALNAVGQGYFSLEAGLGFWKSGASLGNPPPVAEMEAWRGEPLAIAGSWSDNNTAQVELYSLTNKPGVFVGEYATWSKDMDLAVGAIDKWGGGNETWAAAAAGAYDARWTTSLNNLKAKWSASPRGTLYIRFAHEMTLTSYGWAVGYNDRADFVTAWRRYRALQQQIMPEAKLVFCPNGDSTNCGFNWTDIWPGDAYVDVLGVDYYNIWPRVTTAAEWDAQILAYDSHGGPRGIERYRQFAEAHGKPLALPEWGNNGSVAEGWGDAPVYTEKMYAFFKANAGSGPGQVLYEIWFNPTSKLDGTGGENGKWEVWPFTIQPLTSAKYQEVYSAGRTTSPGIPTITLTKTTGMVTVNWTPPANKGSAITGYMLQRRTTGGVWATIAGPAANATSYSDTTVTAGTAYGYRLAAANALGMGTTSAEVTVTA